MKICFLALAGNYHTIKWCDYFYNKGWEVHVISFINVKMNNVILHYIPTGASTENSDVSKLKYLLSARKINKIINTIKPDIISVHYASSYGTVAALAGIKNYYLSVWGSDIYEFPNKSFLHKWLLKFSLGRAPYLLSTSKAMAIEAQKYTDREFTITPFGVDMELFTYKKRTRNDNKYIIGTVKALTSKYGIDYLLKATAIVRNNRPDIPLEVRIAGKGKDEVSYKEQSIRLGISDIVYWLGFLDQSQVAYEWANMDVAIVYSSVQESFGVSAIEAQACGCPVIISDVQGLMEATSPGNSSIVVKKQREEELAKTIIDLYDNKIKRKLMGVAGRKFVVEKYEIKNCFKSIENLFLKTRKE